MSRLRLPDFVHEVIDDPLAFLDDPATAPDASCVSDPTVARFTLPAGLESDEMEPYSSEELGLVGLGPKGWAEPGPGTFARMRSGTDSTSLVLLAMPIDVTETLARITTTCGITGPPAVIDRLKANGLEWETHRTEVSGAVVDFALAPAADGTLLVILTTVASEHDALHAEVFVPAVQALTPSGAGD